MHRESRKSVADAERAIIIGLDFWRKKNDLDLLHNLEIGKIIIKNYTTTLHLTMRTRQTMPPWTCMSDGLLSIQASLARRKTSLWWVASKATERSWSWYKIHDIFQRPLLIFFINLRQRKKKKVYFHLIVLYICAMGLVPEINLIDWLICKMQTYIQSQTIHTLFNARLPERLKPIKAVHPLL